MDMGNMVQAINNRLVKKRKLISVLSFAIAHAIFGQSSVFAIDFIITPSLTFQETYSDNVRLAPAGLETGAFVTEISPGLSLRGINGGRLSAFLDYRLQTIFNSGGDGSTRIFNQLAFNSNYALSRKRRLNVGLRSTISQQNTSNIRTGDNINDLNNRTNVYTVGAFANWMPRFGGFANAVVNLDYNYVANDNAQLLSNSSNMRESVTLISGRDFSRITWVANFNNTSDFRDNGEDVHFQQTQATIRGWVDRYFNFFTTLGYANNSFQGLDNNTNGFFYTVGAQWRPNWWFNIEAGYGNNWHVTSNLSLSQRTRLSVGYFDRSVGLNTGGAWNASVSHTTLRTFWNFTYTEDTTTVQRSFGDEQSDAPGNPLDNSGNPLDNQAVNSGIISPNFTNAVLIRKTANASVSYTTGKSMFNFGGFYQRRKSEDINRTDESVYGVNGSWNWFFLRRTSLLLSPSWQYIQRSTIGVIDSSSRDDRYQIIARLTHAIPLKFGRTRVLNASLEYRYLQQDSTLVLNTFVENRVTVSLFVNY